MNFEKPPASSLEECLAQAIWVGKSLFDRGKVSGSAANLSFRCGDRIYITASGSCFGTLSPETFSQISPAGEHLAGPKPSKEWPLHLALYERVEVGAVLHIHSTFATLWSCLPHPDPEDVLPGLTPYLKMRVGRVALVPFAPPGSQELFDHFREHLGDTNCYLLAHHGPVAGNRDLLQAFYDLEELEETAKLSWLAEIAAQNKTEKGE